MAKQTIEEARAYRREYMRRRRQDPKYVASERVYHRKYVRERRANDPEFSAKSRTSNNAASRKRRAASGVQPRGPGRCRAAGCTNAWADGPPHKKYCSDVCRQKSFQLRKNGPPRPRGRPRKETS